MINEEKLQEFGDKLRKLCDEYQIDLAPSMSIRATLRETTNAPEASEISTSTAPETGTPPETTTTAQ